MSSKKQKFQNIKNTLNLLNENTNTICVFVHLSNLNMIQTNMLQLYCSKNDIKMVSIKLNVFQKLTKNDILSNLCAGPTKLFLFNDPKVFLDFFKNSPLFNKIIPLAVYYGNNFFSYSYFFNYINNIFNKKNIDIKLNFISSVNLQSSSLIKVMSNNLVKFIHALNYLKKKQI